MLPSAFTSLIALLIIDAFGICVVGNITVGDNSRIGAGSVVIDDVPQDSTVVGIPGKVVHQRIMVDGQLQHNRIPDPITCQLNRMKYEIVDLKQQFEDLKNN